MADLWVANAQNEITSSLPMYQRVYAVLREEICDGRYPDIAPMPSEAALAERFGVSRITIRRTLDMLKTGGYITRRQGVGTFAQPSDRIAAAASPRGFVANLADMWSQTVSELLVYTTERAPPKIAALLDLARGAEVQKAVRLRSFQQRPIGLLTTFIPERIANTFTQEEFISMPVLGLLARAGQPSATARQRVTARSADPFTAGHLDIEIGSPLLCVMRLSSNAQGEPISYLLAVYRPDRYELEFDLEAEGPAHRAVWRVADPTGTTHGKGPALFDFEAGEL
jgi:GntR family transcriptional regulator